LRAYGLTKFPTNLCIEVRCLMRGLACPVHARLLRANPAICATFRFGRRQARRFPNRDVAL
jgi:hypothetical protein